jgi:sodium transport system ATP-binding protein
MIAAESVAKRFGRVTALRELSFVARAGAITTLLGANGAGKTTTLRLLAGLVRPDAGRVSVAGHDAWGERLAARRRLGFFPDVVGLYPRLTVREHVELSARLHGLSREGARAAAARALERLSMCSLAGRRTAGFSQGERMKVALCCATVHEPACLVLDEPARGLDVLSIRLLREVLVELKARGTCIVMSSHVMSEVEALSDEVVVLAGGAAVGQGSPAELIRTSGARSLEEAFIVMTTDGVGEGSETSPTLLRPRTPEVRS